MDNSMLLGFLGIIITLLLGFIAIYFALKAEIKKEIEDKLNPIQNSISSIDEEIRKANENIAMLKGMVLGKEIKNLGDIIKEAKLDEGETHESHSR